MNSARVQCARVTWLRHFVREPTKEVSIHHNCRGLVSQKSGQVLGTIDLWLQFVLLQLAFFNRPSCLSYYAWQYDICSEVNNCERANFAYTLETALAMALETSSTMNRLFRKSPTTSYKNLVSMETHQFWWHTGCSTAETSSQTKRVHRKILCFTWKGL